MKIVSSKKGIRTPEFHRKKLRIRRLKTILWVVIIISVISGGIYFLRHDRFLVSAVEVQGNGVTDTLQVMEIVDRHTSGNYLGIVPRSNTLFYPKSSIESEMLRTIPRLTSVDISRSGLQTVLVTVFERQPSALYCDDSMCFFVDNSGLIFSEAPDFSGDIYMVYRTEPALENPLGEKYLSEEDFFSISSFLKSIDSLGLHPKSFIIEGEEYSMELPSGGRIIWKSETELESVRSSLEAFLSDQAFTQEEDALERVLYIDLRFGNKIFYKFR